MKYNEEKVLYLADQQKCLHVHPSEAERKTTLHKLVHQAKVSGLVEWVAKDDSGDYYRITFTGKLRMLTLQIAWRKSQGKDTTEHERQLEVLHGCN